jgi:hypothetical protein
MMRRLSWPVVLAAALLCLAPGRAGAFEISASAAYWTENSSALSVTLGKLWDLTGFQLGPRVGFAYVTSPNSAGVPADPVVRFHATGGGGLDLGLVEIGVEGGYLHDGALFGARVSLSL